MVLVFSIQERKEKMFLRSGQCNLMIETDPIGTSNVPHFLYKPHWEKCTRISLLTLLGHRDLFRDGPLV